MAAIGAGEIGKETDGDTAGDVHAESSPREGSVEPGVYQRGEPVAGDTTDGPTEGNEYVEHRMDDC